MDKQFSVKDLKKLNYFLGIEVNAISYSEIHLYQRKYVSELLTKTKKDHAKPLPTPMTFNLHLSRHMGEAISNERKYKSMVEGLQYATITRPEIAYSIDKASQFIHQPLNEH